jgi:hypothetical protein
MFFQITICYDFFFKISLQIIKSTNQLPFILTWWKKKWNIIIVIFCFFLTHDKQEPISLNVLIRVTAFVAHWQVREYHHGKEDRKGKCRGRIKEPFMDTCIEICKEEDFFTRTQLNHACMHACMRIVYGIFMT